MCMLIGCQFWRYRTSELSFWRVYPYVFTKELERNERNEVIIRADSGKKIMVRQIAGTIARLSVVG